MTDSDEVTIATVTTPATIMAPANVKLSVPNQTNGQCGVGVLNKLE